MVLTITGMHFPADDLAAIQIHDDEQVKPLPGHTAAQIGHVPAPHLLEAVAICVLGGLRACGG